MTTSKYHDLINSHVVLKCNRTGTEKYGKVIDVERNKVFVYIASTKLRWFNLNEWSIQ
jgi:hypothetical protein